LRAKKRFSELNYYDMLDIKPDAAFFEIRHAYNVALQIYKPGALASYSFFTEEERHEILTLIEKAYTTLINENTRKEYDNELLRRGEIQAWERAKQNEKKPVNIFDINRAPAVKTAVVRNEGVQNKVQQSPEIISILNQNEICGSDLKKIRMELNVLVEQISQETRVRLDHLRSLEEDNIVHLPAPVFLKGFVKSYLRCLGVESADEISSRYMDTLKRLQRK
jgi:hypothetical protein